MTKAHDVEQKEPAFKVVDRRRFTEEGDVREEAVDAEENLNPLPSSSTNDKKKVDFKRPPMSFSLFVETLAHQAMASLGIVPWPDSGLVKIDLTVAKETIDILQMLKEKTMGNITKDEQYILENILYQLQVAFVEISERKPSPGE